MATEEREVSRNFRSVYYEKVGCRGVEEKKLLEHLLKEKPLDLVVLREFTRRFTLPVIFREPVWMLLLDISPADAPFDQFVDKEQKALCSSLERALNFMGLLTSDTSVHRKLVLMFLLEKGKLGFDIERQLKSDDVLRISAIAEVFTKLSPPFLNDYTILKHFINRLQKIDGSLLEMTSNLIVKLQQDDNSLYSHLNKLTKPGAMDSLPFKMWYQRCFAGILHETSLIRIWDKVIGGSYQKDLPQIAKLLLTTLREDLLSTFKASEIVAILLRPLSSEKSELVIAKFLEM